MACHRFTGSIAPTCSGTCRMFTRSHADLPGSRSRLAHDSPYADPLLLRRCHARLLQTGGGWCLPSRSDPIWTTSSPSTLIFPLSSLAASRSEINLAQCFLVIEKVFFLWSSKVKPAHAFASFTANEFKNFLLQKQT